MNGHAQVYGEVFKSSSGSISYCFGVTAFIGSASSRSKLLISVAARRASPSERK
jgi:hypothetical protein